MSNIITDPIKASEELKNRKVGIFPTDTAFGIGCRMDDEDAIKRVYELRRRPFEKALIVLVDSIITVEKYCEIPDGAWDLMKKYWPGGLTIILPCKTNLVLPTVRANGNTLAVRFPKHSLILDIIKGVGVPIVAPSANRSGGETPLSLEDVDKTLLEDVDFVFGGVCTIKGVSTIIDATIEPFKIVRQGVVNVDL